MKIRFFTATLFILFFACTSYAQLLVGPVAGANYSWTAFGNKDLKDDYKVKPVPGFHAGMQVAFKVRKRFFLHTSLLYSTKGKVVEGKADKELYHEVTYKYLEMPIVYSVDFLGKTKSGKQFKYYLGIGPNISYWLGGKGEYKNSETVEGIYDPIQPFKIVFRKNEDELPPDEMNVATPNRFQLGLMLEAGIQFEPAPKQRMKVSLRYELGHTYFSRESDGYFSRVLTYQDELQSRNQGFRLSAAYLFDLKIEDRKKGKSTNDPRKRKY